MEDCCWNGKLVFYKYFQDAERLLILASDWSTHTFDELQSTAGSFIIIFVWRRCNSWDECVCCSTVGKLCNLQYKHPRKTMFPLRFCNEMHLAGLIWMTEEVTEHNCHNRDALDHFSLWNLSVLERAKRDGVTQAWYTWSCWLMARFPNPTQHNQSDCDSKHTLSLCVHLPTLPWLHRSLWIVVPPFSWVRRRGYVLPPDAPHPAPRDGKPDLGLTPCFVGGNSQR